MLTRIHSLQDRCFLLDHEPESFISTERLPSDSNREDAARLAEQANAARNPDRALSLMMPLAKGGWLKVPATLPIKQYKQMLRAYLKRLDEADRNGVDLETVAANLRTELSAKS